jgi:hypothetical protein
MMELTSKASKPPSAIATDPLATGVAIVTNRGLRWALCLRVGLPLLSFDELFVE